LDVRQTVSVVNLHCSVVYIVFLVVEEKEEEWERGERERESRTLH
jgi:hypothetical protein